MEQGLEIRQTQTQRLSQQQLLFVRSLELNAPEFEEKVRQEIEANPALEPLDTPSEMKKEVGEEVEMHREGWSPYAYSGERSAGGEIPVQADSLSLIDHLNIHLGERRLKPEVETAARYIIGNLDPDGYLRIPLDKIVMDLAINESLELSEEEAREAFGAVRSLDPAGVGATSLEDCLRLQLLRLPVSEKQKNALRILDRHFDSFTLRHFDKIASSLRLSPREAAEAVNTIRKLNPKPGLQFDGRGDAGRNYIIPDFILEENEGGLSVSLSNRIPELTIQQSFSTAVESLKDGKRRNRAEAEFIQNRYNDARDFINLISRRQKTLMKVASAILKFQMEYFLSRDIRRLRPMIIKDITDMTGFDASVISRSTNGKYIETPWGIFPMRHFFSDRVGDNGSDTEALTNRKLEEEIRELVAGEDKSHPLSDARIEEELVKKGYRISRRTIAKYRDRLKIPVARLRVGLENE